MSESEFVELIDCRFPYGKPLEWHRLSACAARLSPNAAFMVIHEACRPPRDTVLASVEAQAIVRHVRRRFRHPLYRVAEPAIRAHISGRALSQSKAVRLMRKVAEYPNQYNALAICYLSANDRTGVLDSTYKQVVSSWSNS
ncbi:hypothetical protein [Hydrogenophaga sp. Root209]|uniref:hypothetical protein n=1 Tax=Hydrogenophaga sp. Root209 TaxID=1736490 RepID=UPI0012E3CE4E|nr:hypothetical protein [Hydrogenophaga sp. Root209]